MLYALIKVTVFRVMIALVPMDMLVMDSNAMMRMNVIQICTIAISMQKLVFNLSVISCVGTDLGPYQTDKTAYHLSCVSFIFIQCLNAISSFKCQCNEG